MESQLDVLTADLQHADLHEVAVGPVLERHQAWLTSLDDEQLDAVLHAFPLELHGRSESHRRLLAGILDLLSRPQVERSESTASGWSSRTRSRIRRLYEFWGEDFPDRFRLLVLLAARGQADDLHELVELLVSDPPQQATEVVQVVSPLFQRGDFDPDEVFPRLLDGLSQISLAASILDLANYLYRQRRVQVHPGAERASELVGLLTHLYQRLSELSRQRPQSGGGLSRGQRQVYESVAIVVALCDALALIGDQRAVDTLREVARLPHRRLRTESAAALIALGEPTGLEILVTMAAEPVERLRVLAYAEELGVSEEIDEVHQSPEARAEAEMALWLSQPTQFGVPPQSLELVDQRIQYWPGYEEPVACFLFRFNYLLADGAYGNIGIAGPLTHAFRADLADLPPDDIYAAFAGWHAEHDDIYHKDVAELHPQEQSEVDRLKRRLSDSGYDDVRPTLLGNFLGERVLVARALRDGHEGVVVIDDQDTLWRPAGVGSRPLASADWYCIYKGRRMLRNFNA